MVLTGITSIADLSGAFVIELAFVGKTEAADVSALISSLSVGWLKMTGPINGTGEVCGKLIAPTVGAAGDGRELGVFIATETVVVARDVKGELVEIKTETGLTSSAGGTEGSSGLIKSIF